MRVRNTLHADLTVLQDFLEGDFRLLDGSDLFENLLEIYDQLDIVFDEYEQKLEESELRIEELEGKENE